MSEPLSSKQQFPTYEQLKQGWLQMQVERDRLRAALELIEAWHMPQVYDDQGKPTSYAWKYGSQGEKQVIIGYAQSALAGAGDKESDGAERTTAANPNAVAGTRNPHY